MTNRPDPDNNPSMTEIPEDFPDAIVTISESGEILSWNGGAETLFGLARAEALGRSIDQVILPEEMEKAFQAAREGGPVVLETVRLRKDGSPLTVRISGRVVRNREGRPERVIRLQKSTTGIKRGSRAEISETRFGGMIESIPDATVIINREGRIVMVNAQTETLFGYPGEALAGLPIEILVPECPRAAHIGMGGDSIENRQVRTIGIELELYGRRKDGTEFPVEISLGPLRTETGMLAIGTIRNVTERKRLEAIRQKGIERIQEANRLKSEFMANMSHELRTPLNGIIGFAELMYDGKVGSLPPQHKEYMGDILTSAKHLLQLINDVLDLAKIESGKMEFRPEEVDLTKVVWEVRDVLRSLTSKKRIQLEIDIHPGLGPVVIDSGKLKQVLYNYLSNALKFTPNRGRVTIRVKPEETGTFRLEVEDTGIGIRPEDLSRLFVEFQQLDASLAKKYQGTGLGLALTKRIVEAQGGRVGVLSTPGKGSLFFAVLPSFNKGAALTEIEQA